MSENTAIYLKTINFSMQSISVHQECAKINTLSVKKETGEKWPIFISYFYQLFFLLNKNQITEILKKLSDLLYHNLAWVTLDREG